MTFIKYLELIQSKKQIQNPPPSEILALKIRYLGLVEYKSVWQAMKDFTKERLATTPDELWILEHPPVFTLGRSGKEEHILQQSDIPIINVDRGGQVTYHGPGQIVIYLLLDLRRRRLGIRQLVTLIEDCIVNLLSTFNINANNKPNAPGVYVNTKKIAALGLRVSKGCTTHGLSLNVDMDLTPFAYINPCGYEGLEVTQTKNIGIKQGVSSLSEELITLLINGLDDLEGKNNLLSDK